MHPDHSLPHLPRSLIYRADGGRMQLGVLTLRRHAKQRRTLTRRSLLFIDPPNTHLHTYTARNKHNTLERHSTLPLGPKPLHSPISAPIPSSPPPGASGTNRAPRPIPRTTPATCPVGQPRCSRGTGGIGVDPTGRSSACPLLPPIWSSVFPRLLTQPATLSTPPMNSRIDRLLCWLARRQSGR